MLRMLACCCLALLPTSPAVAADAPAAAVAALAPSGTLRAAINFGNPVLAQKDAATGLPRGVSVDLARALGQRLGVPVDLVIFEAAGKVFEALKAGALDVAFLAIDPQRAAEIDYTAPYVAIEGAYLVPAASPLRAVAEVDRPDVRVAVGLGSTYDLFLTRSLKHATIVRAPTSPAAVETFVRDRLEVAAGIRQPLLAYAQAHPQTRVLPGSFMQIEQAMGLPKGRAAGHRYLRGFVEEMKAS
ncbi:MAG: ABC transporter substrate-binding protein, partial [Alphaproteobacteria bacterium]|nr:ABC transporter substrate-binding protein [Alphaproteobacteria bacterium]